MQTRTPFLLQLKFRVVAALATEEQALMAYLSGRDVTIRSERNSQPLSKAMWLLVEAHGFESEEEARGFGEELRRAVHLAGLCVRVGVDAGDPGEDRAVSYVNPEMLRTSGVLDRDMRVAPDIHGTLVLPDDGKTLSVRIGQAEGRALADVVEFVRSLEESLPASEAPTANRTALRRAVRVLNLAELNTDPIAKVVLAISTVEGLAADPAWSDAQQEMITSAADWIERAHADKAEAEQVGQAIRRTRQTSIRQRVSRLLAANALSELWEDWDALYEKRIRLFQVVVETTANAEASI